MNTATASQTIELKKGRGADGLQPGYFARRNVWDWLFAALVVLGASWAFVRYSLDYVEQEALAKADRRGIANSNFIVKLHYRIKKTKEPEMNILFYV